MSPDFFRSNRYKTNLSFLIVSVLDSSSPVSHERTPMDEAVSRGKMDVIDAIDNAVTQVELDGVRVA